jgi:hypothetical protein
MKVNNMASLEELYIYSTGDLPKQAVSKVAELPHVVLGLIVRDPPPIKGRFLQIDACTGGEASRIPNYRGRPVVRVRIDLEKANDPLVSSESRTDHVDCLVRLDKVTGESGKEYDKIQIHQYYDGTMAELAGMARLRAEFSPYDEKKGCFDEQISQCVESLKKIAEKEVGCAAERLTKEQVEPIFPILETEHFLDIDANGNWTREIQKNTADATAPSAQPGRTALKTA